jgi:predicted P-loop ATPase
VISEERLAAGWRLKKAWEVEIMSVGRQVVLPPTLHADTGKPYSWIRPLEKLEDIQLVKVPARGKAPGASDRGEAGGAGKPGRASAFAFDPVPVDLVCSQLSDRIVGMITEGTDVTDRSAALFSAALAMAKAGFTDNEICSVLTDRENFLGDVAYEHRSTGNRRAAAHWIYEYSVKKARAEVESMSAFDEEVEVTEELTDEASKEQAKELLEAATDKDWRRSLDRTASKDGPGKLLPTLKNVIAILENSIGPHVFQRDSFTVRDYYGTATPWGGHYGELITDDNLVNVKVWLARKWRIEPNVNLIHEAVLHIISNNEHHPVKEYLDTLEWDGKPRLDSWLKDCLGAKAPEPYLSDVSRKVLVAAVARVYEPGIKFDHMLILEGKQGIGKSSMGRILAGDKWFLDSLPDLSDKDAALGLLGQWFVEMPELTNFKRSEVETIKAFVTRQIDKVRPPYGRRVVELKRQCIFFGSTNSHFYLVDRTGNRRYWPVVVTKPLDFKRLAAMRDQLFAEAKWIYQNLPEPLYLEDESAQLQASEQQDSKVSDDEESEFMGRLMAFVKKQESHKEGDDNLGHFDFSKSFRIADLLQEMEIKTDNFRLQIAGRVLRRLGYRRRHTERGNVWLSPKRKR